MEIGGKKDAPCIADMIIPLIRKMEKTRDEHTKLRHGVVDLVLFDGASNVVKAGKNFGDTFSSHQCSARSRACCLPFL